jgi:hypothetical protein
MQGGIWKAGPGKEVDAVKGYALGIHYTGVSVMFGIGLLTLWIALTGYSLRNLSARVLLAITGHLRTRPDPWLECALRTAFAEFDQELTLILQDRGTPLLARMDQAGWPANPESPSGSAEPPAPGGR